MRLPVLRIVPILCCLLAAVGLLQPGLGAASSAAKAEKKEGGEGKKKEAPIVVPKPPLDALLAAVQDNLKLGDSEGASRALYLIFYHYPDAPEAESALWLSASLLKEIAQGEKEPKWDKVLDRFRLYLSSFPKGAQAAEAYFEVGRTYQILHFYREAQAYFKLFMERYPESPLMPQAMRGYRNALLREGRSDEAAVVYQEWQRSKDAMIRAMGEVGGGMLKSAAGDYQGALPIYQKVLAALPDYPVADPEILRYAGIANLRLGNTAAGREQLYHYLTLAGAVAERPEVLLELAESYFKEGQAGEAQKLYAKIIDEAGNERAVLISALRRAQYFDNPEVKLDKWQRHNDLRDPEGDKPYLAVLEKLFRDPALAQDARFGLFLRHQARAELEQAYEVGENFLRNAEVGAPDSASGKRVGRILHYLVEELLKAKRYRELCDLYDNDYRHLKDYPDGRLLMMVGEGLDALELYEPAAGLYYLAAQQPLGDTEKTELYFRRAADYVRLNDYDALERLLAYVRKLYAGKAEQGEVDYYAAKLSLARGRIDEAGTYFGEAVSHPSAQERLPEIGAEAVEAMLQNGRLDMAESILDQGATAGWLGAAERQGWLLRLGNGWRLKGDWTRAAASYRKGLAQGLPDTGEAAQAIHLYLGDVLMQQGKQEEALSEYQTAAKGEVAQLTQMASQRLVQREIDSDLAGMAKRPPSK